MATTHGAQLSTDVVLDTSGVIPSLQLGTGVADSSVFLHRQKMRAFLAEQKNKPCTDCGRLYPTECMEWDHIRGKKLFNLADAPGQTRARVEVELLKCDLVCANCHRIRTVQRRRRVRS